MTPEWFTKAIQNRPIQHELGVDGARIACLRWPNPGKPGLLFVHGHAAHAHWWDFIAPLLKDSYDIVAMDLSGYGDSDHRQDYSATGFAAEIVAVLQDAGFENGRFVIGHSFGGSMTRIAAFLHPGEMDGIIMIDAALPASRGPREAPPIPKEKTRYYKSLAEGMKRFRLRPTQPCTNQYLLDHIAALSLRRTDEGYIFKVDQAVFAKMKEKSLLPPATEMIAQLRIPSGLVYGQQSRFFNPPIVSAIAPLFPEGLITGIPGAHHHVFLDQPLAVVSALGKMLDQLQAE